MEKDLQADTETLMQTCTDTLVRNYPMDAFLGSEEQKGVRENGKRRHLYRRSVGNVKTYERG